jgi:inosine-uridine nucleoside N-ribohydrolase
MTPLWIDSDPSGFYHTGLDCDDDLAILVALALHQRQMINLEGLSICGGNAPLRHTWDDVQRLWKYAAGYNRTGIQPIKGFGWRSMQVGVKLLELYNAFFLDVPDSDEASLAISKRAVDASLQQIAITILTLGPPTNVAKAIQQLERDHIYGIDHIYLMGGDLTNRQLDLNFRSDIDSARTIIETNVPKTLIPIQTCGQVSITKEWISKLNCESDNQLAVCAYASKMKQQVRLMPMFVNSAVKNRMTSSTHKSSMVWNPSPNLDNGFIPWDIVALLAVTHPEEFNDWRYHRVFLPVCDDRKLCDGTMQVIDDIEASFDGNWSNVVRIPHTVRNETKLLDIIFDLIKDIEVPAAWEQPRLTWGFAIDSCGFVLATIIFTICCIKLFRVQI